MAYRDPEKQKAYDRERHRKYMNDWRALKGEAYRTRYRNGQLKRQYGLTVEAFDALVESQGNACAACRSPFAVGGAGKLTVDHDHSTGAVRGLLCCACNRTIGHAQESVVRLRACAAYMEGFQ